MGDTGPAPVADRARRSVVEILSRDSQAPEYELNCYAIALFLDQGEDYLLTHSLSQCLPRTR
jgi:hypothetical protein